MDRFEEVKERVKEANDLVALVEGYLPLKRAGSNLLGLCPFHPEKTPSFTVFPDGQRFKCFGCGKGGDVFTFVQEREAVGFREALELLAERAGISLDGVFGGGRRGKGERRVDPHAVLAVVAKYLHAQLLGPAGARGRAYLESRGLAAGIEPFQLGMHPSESGAMRRFAREKGLPLDVLEQAGLLGREGREPFHGRLMFPIEDERGRVVGFGGRALDDSRAKYINSAESPFFRKRKVLYGLRLAKDAGERRIVVMEGYTDVIACHLAGIHGAVATLGTALTQEHGGVLKRWATDGVVLLFDGDRAGRAAGEKAYAELARTGLGAKLSLVPEGSDPADMVAGPDRETFVQMVAEAEDALVMWFRLKRQRLGDLRHEANAATVIEDCAQVLAGLEDPAERALLLGRMARQLGLGEETFRRSLNARKRRPLSNSRSDAEAPAPAAKPTIATPTDKAELELLACILAAPSLVERAVAGWSDPGKVGVLLEAARAAVAGGHKQREALISSLFTRVADKPDLSSLVGTAADVAERIREPEEKLDTLLEHRRVFMAREAAEKIRSELQEASSAGDRARVDELTRRYVTQLREQQAGSQP